MPTIAQLRFLTLLPVINLGALCRAQVASSYRIIDLDPHHSGIAIFSTATAINNAGEVVGRIEGGGLGQIPFRWTEAGGEEELLFPTNASANGINSAGKVVGYDFVGFDVTNAFLWSGNSFLNLPTLGGTAAAYDINDSDQVVGFSNVPQGDTSSVGYPFFWDAAEGIVNLGTLGGLGGQARAINNFGQVTGNANTPNGIPQAFVATVDGGMESIGGDWSIGYAINDNGVIAGSDFNGGVSWIWSAASGKQSLPTLTGGEHDTNAFGLNNHNTVVGASGGRAFVWSDTTGMVDLNDRIDFASSGWTLGQSYAINDIGEIVGTGRNPNGDQHAFLAIPNTFTLPSVKIIGCKMINWHTLDVSVNAVWPLGPGIYHLTAHINGTAVTVDKAETDDPTSEDILVDLQALGVPRFRDSQRFTVTVTPLFEQSSGVADASPVFIPLPVLIVQGLFSDTAVGEPPTNLINQLTSIGYQQDGPTDADYPTVINFDTTLGYRPTFQTLSTSASILNTAINEYTAAPKTYADCVDLVCHSKGGLVARTYISKYDPTGFVVRRLVMACTPQVGSASVFKSPLHTRVLRELAPLDPWFRKLKSNQSPSEFGIPRDWQNAALDQLDAAPLPSRVTYYILYGVGIATPATVTINTDQTFTYGEVDGDGIVSSWSAQGFHIIARSDGTFDQGTIIPTFVNHLPARVIAIAHGHSGFLDDGDAVFAIGSILTAP